MVLSSDERMIRIKAKASADDAEKTRVSGVLLAASQASSFERFTQINADERQKQRMVVSLWKRIYTHEASENAIDISQDSELFVTI